MLWTARRSHLLLRPDKHHIRCHHGYYSAHHLYRCAILALAAQFPSTAPTCMGGRLVPCGNSKAEFQPLAPAHLRCNRDRTDQQLRWRRWRSWRRRREHRRRRGFHLWGDFHGHRYSDRGQFAADYLAHTNNRVEIHKPICRRCTPQGMKEVIGSIPGRSTDKSIRTAKTRAAPPALNFTVSSHAAATAAAREDIALSILFPPLAFLSTDLRNHAATQLGMMPCRPLLRALLTSTDGAFLQSAEES